MQILAVKRGSICANILRQKWSIRGLQWCIFLDFYRSTSDLGGARLGSLHKLHWVLLRFGRPTSIGNPLLTRQWGKLLGWPWIATIRRWTRYFAVQALCWWWVSVVHFRGRLQYFRRINHILLRRIDRKLRPLRIPFHGRCDRQVNVAPCFLRRSSNPNQNDDRWCCWKIMRRC